MRLSPTGWSNDLPDKPGWYALRNTKSWRWYDEYNISVRVDYVADELRIVEEPDDQMSGDGPLPYPLSLHPSEDQGWECFAYKPLALPDEMGILQPCALLDETEQPDVTGYPEGWNKRYWPLPQGETESSLFGKQLLRALAEDDAKRHDRQVISIEGGMTMLGSESN